jgi:hypothetical protein
MRARIIPVFVLVAAGYLSISCGGTTSPSDNVQDPFSGTLAVGGIARHPVTVNNTGEFSIKITALSPTVTAFVGIVWAQGGNCDLALQQNNFSTLNSPALVGAVLQKGQYCVAVYDSGGITVAQNYTLIVSHP